MPSVFNPTTPTWQDDQAGGTDIDKVDLQEHTDALLTLNGAPITLTPQGSTYAQTSLLTDTSRPRRFISTFDPTTVATVADFDTWVSYS